ncbi:Protein ALP1-like like protein [Argiope bruennichi]|uniref:Protein ALP1-like like protein n=1 Tax=Argiope bruennichi TaxID=94029 RepID=A0A8T0FFK5_ARGBR|nr:Protein ALP1-like like protein [Argiope bruennichi]
MMMDLDVDGADPELLNDSALVGIAMHSELQLKKWMTERKGEDVVVVSISKSYLAGGCTFTNIHYSFRVGISTAGVIVRDVCQTLWKVMQSECIPLLTKEKWESIARRFENAANFPHCIVAVDGNMKALKKFKKLPDEKCLPGTESPKVPYFFVGEAAFGLHKHLVKPYGGTHLTVEKRIFNCRLCPARRYIECAFGMLSNKWRIFHRPLNVQPQFAKDIVKACIILHNYVRDRGEYMTEDTMSVTGLEDTQGENTIRVLKANNVRNILCKYFCFKCRKGFLANVQDIKTFWSP